MTAPRKTAIIGSSGTGSSHTHVLTGGGTCTSSVTISTGSSAGFTLSTLGSNGRHVSVNGGTYYSRTVSVIHSTHNDADHTISFDSANEQARALGENLAHFIASEANGNRKALIPPGLGETLVVLFAPKNRIKHILGDLAEQFAEDVETKGVRRARLLFWTRVIRSIGPLLWTKIKRAGWTAVIFEMGRRWIG